MCQREGVRMTPLAVAYLGPNSSPCTALPAVLSMADNQQLHKNLSLQSLKMPEIRKILWEELNVF